LREAGYEGLGRLHRPKPHYRDLDFDNVCNVANIDGRVSAVAHMGHSPPVCVLPMSSTGTTDRPIELEPLEYDRICRVGLPAARRVGASV